MAEVENSVVTLNARSIIVGTLNVTPVGPVVVSPDGFDLWVKRESPRPNRAQLLKAKGDPTEYPETKLAIAHYELTCFEYYFGKNSVGMNVAFLQATADCAQRLRLQLNMDEEMVEIHTNKTSKRERGSRRASSSTDITDIRVEHLPFFGPSSKQASRHRIMLEFEGNQVNQQLVMLALVKNMFQYDLKVQGLEFTAPRLVILLSEQQAHSIVKLIVHACQHLNDADPPLQEAVSISVPQRTQEAALLLAVAEANQEPTEIVAPSMARYDSESAALVDTKHVAYTIEPPALRRTSHSYTNSKFTGSNFAVDDTDHNRDFGYSSVFSPDDTNDSSAPKSALQLVSSVLPQQGAAVLPPTAGKRARFDQNQNVIQGNRPSRARKKHHYSESSASQAKAALSDMLQLVPTEESVHWEEEVPGSVIVDGASLAVGAFKGIPIKHVLVNENAIKVFLDGVNVSNQSSSSTVTGFRQKLVILMQDVVRCLLHAEPVASSAMFVYITPSSSSRLLHSMVFSPSLHKYHDTMDRFNNCNTLALLLGTVPGEQRDKIQRLFARAESEHPLKTSLLSLISYSVAEEYLGSCFSKDLLASCMGKVLPSNGQPQTENQPRTRSSFGRSRSATAQPRNLEASIASEPSSVSSAGTVFLEPMSNGEPGLHVQPAKKAIVLNCPFTQKSIRTPVENNHCKHSYEYTSIAHFLETPEKIFTCPVEGCTNEIPIKLEDLRLNLELKDYIEKAT